MRSVYFFKGFYFLFFYLFFLQVNVRVGYREEAGRNGGAVSGREDLDYLRESWNSKKPLGLRIYTLFIRAGVPPSVKRLNKLTVRFIQVF